MSRIGLALFWLLAWVPAVPVGAVDGVIEINHARAIAGGVTPGDSANYPVTLSQPGSYRLTGALSPSGVSAIAITASGVTLDLNGFRVAPAAGAVGVDGIDAGAQTDARIMNGAVEFFGGDGIQTGDRARIENVTVRNNGNVGNAGISVGAASLVIGSTAHGNLHGIATGPASTVTGNLVNGNLDTGLLVGAGNTVSENTVSSNGGDGIRTAGGGCTLLNNTVYGNGGDGIEVFASAVIGNTVSSNARCGLHTVGPDGSDTTGFAHNVLNANNGSSSNRQVSASSTLIYMDTYNFDDSRFFANVCGNYINSSCQGSFPQNNCP